MRAVEPHDLAWLDRPRLGRRAPLDPAGHRRGEPADLPRHVGKPAHLHPVARHEAGRRRGGEIDPHATSALLEVERLGKGERHDARGAHAVAAGSEPAIAGDRFKRQLRGLERRCRRGCDHREIGGAGDDEARGEKLPAGIPVGAAHADDPHPRVDQPRGERFIPLRPDAVGEFDGQPSRPGFEGEHAAARNPPQALHDACGHDPAAAVGAAVEPGQIERGGLGQRRLAHDPDAGGKDVRRPSAADGPPLDLHEHAHGEPRGAGSAGPGVHKLGVVSPGGDIDTVILLLHHLAAGAERDDALEAHLAAAVEFPGRNRVDRRDRPQRFLVLRCRHAGREHPQETHEHPQPRHHALDHTRPQPASLGRRVHFEPHRCLGGHADPQRGLLGDAVAGGDRRPGRCGGG